MDSRPNHKWKQDQGDLQREGDVRQTGGRPQGCPRDDEQAVQPVEGWSRGSSSGERGAQEQVRYQSVFFVVLVTCVIGERQNPRNLVTLEKML